MRCSTLPTRARYASIVGAVVALVVVSAPPALAGGSEPKRLDDVRLLGTHNSYHLRPARELLPDEPADYAHAPLDVQLEEQGVRSVELDTFNGPTLPVFHSLVVDAESTCPTLESCLAIIDEWSRANSQHEPIVVFFEPKPLPTSDNPTVQEVITNAATDQGITEWDTAGLERVDELVRTTFGRRLITPDEVRGNRASLRAAVRSGEGWPTLKQARGKVLVVLIGDREIRELYTDETPTLEGRAMFVDSEGTEPFAAVISADRPNPKRFRRLVDQHFLVKTRADADGKEARANDRTRADAALASGAQIVVTDYPVPDPSIGPYVVTLP